MNRDRSPQAKSKPSLSLSFHNFWKQLRPEDNFFVSALREVFDVEVVAAGRDLQLSSVFGRRPLPTVAGGRPLRVWWTGEASDPEQQAFDLYFGFRPTRLMGSRWYRYPIWITVIDWWNTSARYHVSRLTDPRPVRPRPIFANFIYTKSPSIRTEFFLRLNEIRRVESAGRVLNNSATGLPTRDKLAILADCLFTIAFENQIAAGYVTEKLLDPLLEGSIPIYWGAPEAKTDFNPDAFIDAESFDSLGALIRHILRLADSPDAIAALTAAPPFAENRIPYEHTPRFFADRINEALSGTAERIPERWNVIWNPRDDKRLGARIRSIFRGDRA